MVSIRRSFQQLHNVYPTIPILPLQVADHESDLSSQVSEPHSSQGSTPLPTNEIHDPVIPSTPEIQNWAALLGRMMN